MMSQPFELNLRHLRSLLAIAEHGSITAASEIVSLSQPALTQGVAKLERQFGYALFDRRAGGMAPTPKGEIVIERVRLALEHLSEASRQFSAIFRQPERLMTMPQLRGFVALADAGSFAAASLRSGLSQTAVHRAVGDLEQMIGLKLIERRGRDIWLNQAGRRLARGARLAVAEIAAAFADLGIDSGSGDQLISFGASPLSRPYLVPSAMAAMARTEIRSTFKVLEGSWRELVEPLREGVIDIVVGALRPYEVGDLSQKPLFEDRLVVAAGSQHPLVHVTQPDLDQLRAYPWIVAPPGSPLRDQWERLFAGPPSPHSPIECGSVMIIGRLLTESNFLTLLSPDQVALQIRIGLLAQIGAPLEHSKRIVGISTRRSWRPTLTQRRFLELLEETAGAIQAENSESSRRDSAWI